jgi:hypothetical protein
VRREMRSRDDGDERYVCVVVMILGIVLRMILALALAGSISASVDDILVA